MKNTNMNMTIVEADMILIIFTILLLSTHLLYFIISLFPLTNLLQLLRGWHMGCRQVGIRS